MADHSTVSGGDSIELLRREISAHQGTTDDKLELLLAMLDETRLAQDRLTDDVSKIAAGVSALTQHLQPTAAAPAGAEYFYAHGGRSVSVAERLTPPGQPRCSLKPLQGPPYRHDPWHPPIL